MDPKKKLLGEFIEKSFLSAREKEELRVRLEEDPIEKVVELFDSKLDSQIERRISVAEDGTAKFVASTQSTEKEIGRAEERLGEVLEDNLSKIDPFSPAADKLWDDYYSARQALYDEHKKKLHQIMAEMLISAIPQ